jgi:DNA-binding NtrC family response regulator
VAATNVDLQKAVAKGKFREDLYYRLSTVQIQVPSLHDRGDDIILLARKFARDFSEKYMTSPITFGDDVRRLMLTYNWPGNVRQLKNVVEQLALFEAGQEVSREEMLELLPTNGFSTSAIIKKPETHNYETEREVLWQLILSMKSEIQKLHDMITSSADGDNNIVRSSSPLPILNFVETSPYSDAGQTLEDSEKDTIVAALERNGGSKKRAAAELNISERTLYRKIRDYNLDKYTQRPLTATLKKQQE